MNKETVDLEKTPLDKLADDPSFYQLPLDAIMERVKRDDFAIFENPVELIKKIYDGVYSVHKENAGFLLGAIDVSQCNFAYKDLEDIMKTFTGTSCIIKQFFDASNEFNIVEDSEFYLSEKQLQIDALQEQVKKLQKRKKGMYFEKIPFRPSNYEIDIAKAIKHYDIYSLRYTIDNKPSLVKKRMKGGITPFMYCCMTNFVKGAQYLYYKWGTHFDINERGLSSNFTPLQMAIYYFYGFNMNLELIKFLLEINFDIEALDKYGNNALGVAAQNSFITKDVLRFLVQEKHGNYLINNNAGWTPYFIAIKHHNLEFIKFMTDFDNSLINQPSAMSNKLPPIIYAWSINQQPRRQRTTMRNSNEVFEYFLNNLYTDLNATDSNGKSLLHYACKAGDKNLIENLIKYKGMDPLKKNINGLSPYEYAKNCNQNDVISLIDSLK